jgi:hypothetical protein
MSGFNLPPGCSVGDLPGNSAEDMRREQAIEQRRDDLLGGELAAELPEDEARELLTAVINALYQRRDHRNETHCDYMRRIATDATVAIECAVDRITDSMEID